MRYGRWISGVAAIAVAGGLAAGCANEEPRELGRADQGSVGQYEEGQGGGQAIEREGRQDRIDQAAVSHELDGKRFMVQVRGAEGETIDDELIFRDGTFDSIACHEHGFSAAPYTALKGPEGDLTFRSITTSGESKMRWNGTVKGDSIEGTAVVDEPGKEPVYYSYSGSLETQGQAGSLGGQQEQESLQGK